MNESTRHVDLLKAFAQDSCPICRLVLRDTQRDLDVLMVERINAVDTHLAFRAGRGLCNAHAWNALQAKGGSLGIAVMFESTMVELFKDARRIKPTQSLFGRKNAGETAAETLAPSGVCILCESMTRAENSYVGIVAENLDDKQLGAAFQASQGGVCLPHAQMVLKKLSKTELVERFLALQNDKWQALQVDLQRFIHANEANIPIHQMGAEGDSWQRAVAYLSGSKDVFGYRR